MIIDCHPLPVPPKGESSPSLGGGWGEVGVLLLFLLALSLFACGDKDDPVIPENFRLEEIIIDGQSNLSAYTDINPQNLSIEFIFSTAFDKNTIEGNITLKDKNKQEVKLLFTYPNEKTVLAEPESSLNTFTDYELVIWTGIKSQQGTTIMTGKTYSLSTGLDLSDKFPRIPDEELLDLVQSQTFKYFWDFGHPTSGMARERTTSGHTVATGGTGFGVMAMIVAAERGFVLRNDALQRVQKIVTFLDEKCEKFHGAYSHWINGETGKTVPFSTYDDGGDLVETALLFQGLLAAGQYFNSSDGAEVNLRNDITRLWEAIEWTWYQQDGQNVLYWHWSPTYHWQMNMKITGWNEALIVYVLAASSPTYPISKEVYTQGWARNGAMANGKLFYGLSLPLGNDYGGPLFFSHYSFLGINPKGLSDQYADYWTQNQHHSLINYKYCIENPKKYAGYGADCWGLTASDGNGGYSAHSPTDDKGVIAPTAALSSMPYTPEESMNALRFFYYKLGDQLWSDYGFYDAFNLSAQWFDNQHIAIDQGPIVVMIENYRTGLLWSLFMADEEIKEGLRKLGFQSPD